MALTDINSEDRLVQQTFANHLEKVLGWDSVYAYNAETFGPQGMLGRASEREVVLVRDLRAALARLNPDLPESAREQAIEKITRIDFARSLIQHNREIYRFIRGGVPVEWQDAAGEIRHAHAHVLDFRDSARTRFLAVRELKVQGVRVPHYNRRADLPGGDHAEGLKVDLSQIDFGKLRDEFSSKVRRKHAALQDIRDVVEKKLAQMLARNPMRMDFYKKYQEIIADYNREKDRATVEATFAQLVALAASLDAEQRRAAEEGLNDDELALFDLLFRASISKTDRERLKQASQALLSSLRELIRPMPGWLQNSTTQAQVKIFILDKLYQSLPRPPFTDDETEAAAELVYDYIWQRSASGQEIGAP